MNHDEYKQHLIKEYKDKVHKHRNISEVMKYLNNIVNLNIIEISDIDRTFFHITEFNFLNSVKNKDLNLTMDELEFEAYEVIQDDKSKYYYEENNKAAKQMPIIVLLEKNMEAITSNCEILKQELHIAEGINQYHIDNETSEFFAYLVSLDVFENGRHTFQ